MAKRATIRISSSIFEDEIGRRRERMSRHAAWLWLLTHASQRDGTVKRRRSAIPVKRGQTICSLHELSEAWNWPRTNVGRFLACLVQEGYVTAEKSPGPSYAFTILTIVGYDNFSTARYRRTASNGASLSTEAVDAKALYSDIRRREFNRSRAQLALALIDSGVPYVCAHPDCTIRSDLAVDHKLALSRGGSDDLVNLQFMCHSHNSAKGDR